MALEVKDLLALPPRDATARLVLQACRPGLTAKQIRLLQMEPTRDPILKVLVSITRSGIPVTSWKYDGRATFSYVRLRFSDIFGTGVLDLPISAPERTGEILPALAAHAGVVFDDEDVVDRPVHLMKDGTYILQASPRSWRWYGELRLRFVGLPKVTQLAKVDDPWQQKKDPTPLGYGSELRALKRGSQLSAPGRVWCRWLNAALDQTNQWVIDTVTASPFNVGLGRVLTNARVESVPEGIPVAQPAYRLMVALDRQLCKDMGGVLTIYYSDPEQTHA